MRVTTTQNAVFLNLFQYALNDLASPTIKLLWQKASKK